MIDALQKNCINNSIRFSYDMFSQTNYTIFIIIF